MKRRKSHSAIRIITVIFVALSVVIILATAFIYLFVQNHFMYNTYIEEVDCSFLTIEQAKTEIESSAKAQKMVLSFKNGKQYEEEYNRFDVRLSNDSELREILAKQNIFDLGRKDYLLKEDFNVNQAKIEEYLKTIAELQPENMTNPQNAFLQFGDDQLLEIAPEVYGSYVKFDEACREVENAILSGKEYLDFSNIMDKKPEITCTDAKLAEEQNYINAILQTTIKFELSDNSVYTLDRSVMHNWVHKKADGSCEIELEENVLKFVHHLSEKANEVNSNMIFSASDLGNINILLQNSEKALVDEEAEFKQIMQELGTAKTITRKPIYDKELLQETLSTYIEVDIARQRVWMYVDGECILNTPCVTGSVRGGHSTETGIYYLNYKTRNATLKGRNNDGSIYVSPVSYWMPFNDQVGFHDASWRDEFGGEIYKTNGSHGCINLPYEAAKTLYQNIDKTIPIIIYSS